MNLTHKNQSGFTLIELCIVIVIVGIMVAGAVQAYTIYDAKQQIERMNTQMVDLDQAIQAFSAAEGRLPCPAPVNGSTAGNDYNAEECTGAHGVIEVAGTGGSWVLIGKYPAATLGLDTSNMKDVHGNYLVYAVTKSAAVDGGNVTGGIRVIEEGIDEDANSSTAGEIITKQTHNNVQYVVLSLGSTSKGAFAYDGTILNTCSGDAKEVENCDYNNAIFVSSVQSDSQEDLFYDDRVVFKNKSAAVSSIPNLLKPAVDGQDFKPKGKAYRVGTYEYTTSGDNQYSKDIVRQDYNVLKDGYLEHTLSASRDDEGRTSQSFGTGAKIKLKAGDVINQVSGGSHGYVAINNNKIEFNKNGKIIEKGFEVIDPSEIFIYGSPSSNPNNTVVHFSKVLTKNKNKGSTTTGFGMWVDGN